MLDLSNNFLVYGSLHGGTGFSLTAVSGCGFWLRIQYIPQSTYIGRDETGSVYLPTQLERTLQLYW